jgi:hypothetical protein
MYALKKVGLHVRFEEGTDCPILQHPAMKEIEAISKLQHKNIVGYRGCWIEAEEVDTSELQRIMHRVNRTRTRFGHSIEEQDQDDPDFILNLEINEELVQKAFHQKTLEAGSDRDEPSEISEEDLSEESDCDSECSMY